MFWCKKKQIKPIKLAGTKPEAMSQADWEDLDELARSTIMLTLSKSVYFNVKDMKTTYTLWSRNYAICTRNRVLHHRSIG